MLSFNYTSVRLESNPITLMVASAMPLSIASPLTDMWCKCYTCFRLPSGYHGQSNKFVSLIFQVVTG
jgi:hypothetical protein